MPRPFLLLFCCFTLLTSHVMAEEITLFDGKTLSGWEGETKKTWRVENGTIVGGSLTEMVPNNEFLATKEQFKNFELTLKFKLEGTEGFVNGGVQFHSERIPNHHEMIGYQADIGPGYDGTLYDESRRNKPLQSADQEKLKEVVKQQDWNDYRILAVDGRIQLWINGHQTVDYTEEDATIPQTGLIALQVHGDGKALISFRDIVIRKLP